MIDPSPSSFAPPPPQDSRANVTIGVIVPLLQSFITGVLAALLIGVVVILFGVRPWKWSALAFVLGMGVSWYTLVNRWVNVVHFIENITQTDINQDGTIGEPASVPAPPQTIRIVVDDRPGHTSIANFPVPLYKVARLFKGLLGGMPFTERAWTGARRPFSQSEFFDVREVGIKNGWWVWVNDEHHQQGCVLTSLGEAIGRKVIEEYERSKTTTAPEGYEPIRR